MIKLSERLKMIADNIEPGSGVADIGTDHGYLPIYLCQTKKYGKVIATDVNTGPLQKAKANFILTVPDMKPDLRLGDGLDPLKPGEVETGVIAGLGGYLISDMLTWELGKTLTYKRFILQPRNNSGKLRRDLYKLGFRILREDIAFEQNRFCEIITCEPPKEVQRACEPAESGFRPSEVSFDYPDLLIKGSLRNVRSYLESQLRTENEIMAKIGEGTGGAGTEDNPDYQKRVRHAARIRKLLAELDAGGKR